MVKCPQNAGLLKTELPPVFSTTSGRGGSKEECLIRRNKNEHRGSPVKTGRDATECGVRIAGMSEGEHRVRRKSYKGKMVSIFIDINLSLYHAGENLSLSSQAEKLKIMDGRTNTKFQT